MVGPSKSVGPLARVLALGLALLVATSSTGLAQESDDAEKAKKYYQQGMKAVYKENYAMAITNFKRAHSISPSGTLLYNISIAHSRMGNSEKALEYSEKAAGRDDLPDDTAVKNRGRIAGYVVANRSKSLAGTTGAQASAEPKDSRKEAQSASAPSGPQDGSGRPPSSQSGGNGLTWVGAGVGLAGAGALTWSIIMNFNVRRGIEAKRTAEQNGNYEKADRLYRWIDSRQTLGQVLLYSGAGTMALGTTLLLVGATSSGSAEPRAVRVTGGPLRNGLRLGLDVRF